jgi:tetratricopeptide (TPR) repeat protein
MLYHARRFEEMLAHARRVQKHHPDLPQAHWLVGLALEQQGKYADAATAFETCLRSSHRDPRATPALGHVYGLLGKRADALRLIETSRDGIIKADQLGPTGIALIYLGLGDKDSAFAWLEKAFKVREGALPYVKLDPRCDRLRSDPRFAALLKKLRL